MLISPWDLDFDEEINEKLSTNVKKLAWIQSTNSRKFHINPFTTKGDLIDLLGLTPDDFTCQRETSGGERV